MEALMAEYGESGRMFSRDAKRAMISQFLGFGLDAYDMALVIVLAPVLTRIFASPAHSEAWQYLSVAIFYSITMAARPIGAAVFGHYADKIGRRNLLIYTIAGVGVMSLFSAFIPTKDQVGVVPAYIIFSILRFVMGCFFGGEYAVGHAFAIEHAPRHRRGLVGGFIQSGFPLGYAIGSFAVLGLTLWLGEAAMYDYGWRLIFASGVAPVLLALFIRSKLVESPEFERAKAAGIIEAAPFASLFRPPTRRVFLQVFFFVTGLFLTDYAIYQFMPKILNGPGKFDLRDYTFIYGIALLGAFVGYNLYGWLSDRLGRRKLTMCYSIFCIVMGIPLYQILINAAYHKNFMLAVCAAMLAALLKIQMGVLPAYLSERFPTRSRSVGVGFGYSAGALVGGAGITPLVALFHVIPWIAQIEGEQELWLSASVVLTIGAVVSFVNLYFSPETKDVELSEVGCEVPAADTVVSKA